ncbi:hypothetical protein SAMN05192574_10729 [Mucilaginibacter gossypiicola]|uniref:Lipocalin-like domain-containing protein n=1 Tax=Mucilaginibacter gossypiicola TaxID=551995 RepID=A0A1H8NNB3_9SPHI|nr:hypothetical protein [Mucilaginibacter gossypiicola]SEO31221.1 hypothetical protein SAMN05192574_10729 [Mucilaginibacter gossypiicola]
MKKLLFIPLLLIMLSCNSNSTDSAQNKRNITAKNDPAKNIDGAKNKQIANTTSPGSEVSKNIIGVWAINGEENPIFEINKDSIYYPEHSVSYKYKITGDSIRIGYDEGEQSFAFKLKNNDTLIIKSLGGDTVYQHRLK